MRPAVDHSMAGGGGAGKSRIPGRLGYGFGSGNVPGEGTAYVDQEIIALAPDPKLPSRQADALHCTLSDLRLAQVLQAVEGKLQRGGATIDTQNDTFWRRHIVLLNVLKRYRLRSSRRVQMMVDFDPTSSH
jgi:hypothetical protein